MFLCEGFLQLRQAGATLHRGVWASQCRGLSCCGAQAPNAQAQQLWLTGPVAPRHVGSSQTRARTHVPCIGRQTLNHCANQGSPIAALFTIARTWKQPNCPSSDEWIKKMWHIYTMEYYSAIKRNEIELFVVRWMELESVIHTYRVE